MDRMTMAGALLATCLAGCGQADRDRSGGVGPAQQAGKTLDEAGAKLTAKVHEEVGKADATAREARANAPETVEKARRGLGDAAHEVGETMAAAGRTMRRSAAERSADLRSSNAPSSDAAAR